MGDALIIGLDSISNIEKKKYQTLSIILDDTDDEDKQKMCAEQLTEKWPFGRNLKSITIAYKTDICKNGYNSEYFSKTLKPVFSELLQAIFCRKYFKLKNIYIHHIKFDLDVLSKGLFKEKKCRSCGCCCRCCHPEYECFIPNIDTIDISYTELKYRKEPELYVKLAFLHRLLLFSKLKKFNMLFCQSVIKDSNFFIDENLRKYVNTKWHQKRISQITHTINFYGTRFSDTTFKPDFLQLLKGKSIFILDADSAPSEYDKENKSLAILKLRETEYDEDKIEFIAHK